MSNKKVHNVLTLAINEAAERACEAKVAIRPAYQTSIYQAVSKVTIKRHDTVRPIVNIYGPHVYRIFSANCSA